MRVLLRPSIISEAPAIAEVLQQANAHKQAHGDEIWGRYPFTTDEVSEMIEAREMFTAMVGSAVAGCVKVTETDQRIWGEEGLDDRALYIHRLATADKFRGKGLGGTIIDLVGMHAKHMEREFLRLDCPSDNILLGAYYLREGFSLERVIELPGRPGADLYRPSLFQRDVNPPAVR